jgi:hypothetical protein
MRAGGRDVARLHLAYLERDGVERDGSAGVLYGAVSDFDRVAFAEEIGGGGNSGSSSHPRTRRS